MAQFEEIGVTALVDGYDRFIFQIGRMGNSIINMGTAAATGAGGLGVASAALGVLIAGAAAAVAAILPPNRLMQAIMRPRRGQSNSYHC